MTFGTSEGPFAMLGLVEETVADVGPVEVEEQDRTSFPVTPVASGAILVLGADLFYVGHRRAKKE